MTLQKLRSDDEDVDMKKLTRGEFYNGIATLISTFTLAHRSAVVQHICICSCTNMSWIVVQIINPYTIGSSLVQVQMQVHDIAAIGI